MDEYRPEDVTSVTKDELMSNLWHYNGLNNGSEETVSYLKINCDDISFLNGNDVTLIENFDSTTQQSELLVENIEDGTEFIFDTSVMDIEEWTLFTGDIESEFHILDEDHIQLCKICGLQYISPENELNSEICGLCIGNVEVENAKSESPVKSNEKTSPESPTEVKYNKKGEGRYYCNVCDKKFCWKKSLTEHSFIHSKEKPFQCHICLKQLNRKSRLKQHLLKHDLKSGSAKILVCSICKTAFKHADEAQLHVNQEGECTDYSNTQQTVSTDVVNNVKLEVEVSDTPAVSEDKNNQGSGENLLKDLSDVAKKCIVVLEAEEIYQCDYCEKSYYEKDSLNKHKDTHKGLEKPYKCVLCGLAFDTYSKRISHQLLHKMYRQNNKFLECPDLNVESDKFPVIRLFVCEGCNKTFSKRSNLNNHQKNVHNKNQPIFKCDVCAKEYISKSYYTQHVKRVHQGANGMIEERALKIISTEPSFHCSECGVTFLHSSSLRNHKRRMHNKEANFSCNKCGKLFFGAHDLKKHVTLHTGERPFQCDVCKHSFRTKSSYNEHVRTHSGEKPYSCDICGHAFTRARAMKSHRLNHLKKKIDLK